MKPYFHVIKLQFFFRHEIRKIITTNLLRQNSVNLPLYLDKITVFFCVLTTILTRLPLSAQFIFVLINTFRNINIAVVKRGQFALVYYGEAKSSLQRIEDFLLCEYKESQDLSTVRGRYNKTVNDFLSTSPQPSRPPGFCFKHIEVKFENSRILSNVSFEVLAGELVGIAGAAGSGKSTLLQVILKEVEPTKGLVDVEGTLSYSAQEAWIFSASVRQNVLFGQEMDMDKYQEVMRVCALEDDLSLFPHGDQTLVGERGMRLSGGQKARISLARAVYRDADIYLLDDPLSAVDAHVAEHIFNECIFNYLKNKCVVLVTHQIKYLTKVDKMYFIEDGKLTAGESRDKVNKLANDNKIETTALKKFGAISEVKERRGSEAPSQNLYKKYYFAGHWSMSLFILIMFIFVQLLNSGIDFFVAFSLDLTDNPNNSSFELKQILPTQTFLYLYAILTVILVISVHSLTYWYIRYCTSVSQKLHKALFDATLAVPMKFFNDHSSGRILNRFSKDVGCIDQVIPMILFEVIFTIFYVIGICVVISILNYWLILPTVVLILVFYAFAHLYKPTNKSIRRTEGIGTFNHI
jgi:ATP-binding cassette subfamily C (CFTR/MRP) protein 4